MSFSSYCVMTASSVLDLGTWREGLNERACHSKRAHKLPDTVLLYELWEPAILKNPPLWGNGTSRSWTCSREGSQAAFPITPLCPAGIWRKILTFTEQWKGRRCLVQATSYARRNHAILLTSRAVLILAWILGFLFIEDYAVARHDGTFV